MNDYEGPDPVTIGDAINDALNKAREMRKHRGSRALTQTITKMEEAELWFGVVLAEESELD